MGNTQESTLGEKRVRTTFNPSGEGTVHHIKEATAELINACESMRPAAGEVVNTEKLRLIALAQTAYEEAAMWAVKAATI
jgi:hypothetical protein